MVNNYKKICILSFVGIIIGIVVGFLDTIFGKTLLQITEIRNTYFIYLVPFLSISGIFIVFIYKKLGKKSIKGMNLIFEVYQNKEEKIPLRLIPLIILTTWTTHLFGGSAGREGVAVQIGATFSNWLGFKFNLKDCKNILLITGMAAGFSGLFQTPISAIFFALEVLIVGKIQYIALIPATISAFVSAFTSKSLGLEKFSVPLNIDISFDFYTIIKLIPMGIIFGLVGFLFAYLLKFFKNYFNNLFKNPLIKIFTISILLSLLFILLHKGRYSGLGTNLIQSSFNNSQIYSYDFLLKFILTIITLSIGFQGGEVTPLFAIGSSLGVVLAGIFNLPVSFVACLGYLSVFGSATNTFFAPLFIGCEVFGFSYMPFYFIVMIFAFTFNFNKSIYQAQLIDNT